jgi:hypothetical protein
MAQGGGVRKDSVPCMCTPKHSTHIIDNVITPPCANGTLVMKYTRNCGNGTLQHSLPAQHLEPIGGKMEIAALN